MTMRQNLIPVEFGYGDIDKFFYENEYGITKFVPPLTFLNGNNMSFPNDIIRSSDESKTRL